MLAANPVSDQSGSVTGTLLAPIRQGRVTTDRGLRDNASLRADIARRASENAELRAGFAARSGEAPS